MAYITSPAVAVGIVEGQRHAAGLWGDLTARQQRRIRGVIRADQRGQVTRQDIVDRLHAIARDGQR